MKEGTFLVTHADENSAVVRDVSDGQVHTLADDPGVEPGHLVEATLEADPPMEVTWTVVEVDRQYAVEVTESGEPPTERAREAAADQSTGDLTRFERAGTGEVHVLTVPESDTESAVADVLDDETTVERAGRIGVERVEVRSEPGVVSVRYLP